MCISRTASVAIALLATLSCMATGWAQTDTEADAVTSASYSGPPISTLR